MRRTLNIALAQLNFLVGDIEGNGERILKTMAEQQAAGADLVMFSELALSGIHRKTWFSSRFSSADSAEPHPDPTGQR